MSVIEAGPACSTSVTNSAASKVSLTLYASDNTFDKKASSSFPVVIEMDADPSSPLIGRATALEDYFYYPDRMPLHELESHQFSNDVNTLLLAYEASNSDGQYLGAAGAQEGPSVTQNFTIASGEQFMKVVTGAMAFPVGKSITFRAYLIVNGKLAAASNTV